MAIYYVDSNAIGGGDGSQATPYNTLSSIPTVAAGDTVRLKRGSVFRATLTVPASGSSGNVISYEDYGSGVKPIIRGSDVVGSWSAYGGGLGQTWQASLSTNPNMVFMAGEFLYKGASATALNNGEWFWVSNVLYVRDDAGSSAPAGTVEASVRNNCISAPSRSYVSFFNLKLEHDNSTAFSTSGTNTGLLMIGLEFDNCWQWVSSNNAGTTWERCFFDHCWQEGTSASGMSFALASSTHTFRYCVVRRCGMRAIRASAALTLNIDNCLLTTGRYPTLYNTAASTCTIRNSFVGAGPVDVDEVAVNWTAGTLQFTNCHVQRSATNGRTTSFLNGAGITLASSCISQSLAPKFVEPAKVGILSFVIDDSYSSVTRCGSALRSALGVGVTCAVYTNGLDATGWSALQAILDSGDDVANHGRWHFDLTTANGITGFRYIGSGSSATVSIGGSPKTLTTTVTDQPTHNLSINLEANTLGQVVSAITAGGNYTATRTTVQPAGSPGDYLANLSSTDCKTGTISLANDLSPTGTVYAGEIIGAKAEFAANLTQPILGGPYPCTGIIWPQGGTNAAAISASIAAGHLGARRASVENQRLQDLDIWRVGCHVGVKAANVVLRLEFESSGVNLGSDTSQLANNFTNVNVVRESTGIRGGFFSAQFNGTSAYLHRATITGLDYTGGDWLFAVYVRPSTLTSEHTIFFHGNDGSNFHRLWIVPSGAIHYEIVASGTQVVHLYTDNGRIASGAQTAICVRQAMGNIQLLWGNSIGPFRRHC